MESFGRYELRRRLGTGGMAEVYEAVAFAEHGVEKPLVIKRILEEHSTDPAFKAMFVDEARVAMQLSHPNVVQVFDFGLADERYFLAMEHVRGKDLGELLAEVARKRQRVPLEVALFVVGEVAKALDYAHRVAGANGRALGIVHRDVSPSNVLLSTEGAVKIGDFGIARFENRRGKTVASTVRGKVRYMSPEQVEGTALDGRSDLFALGSVFYEMLVGRHAFDGKTDLEVMAAVRRAQYRRPSEVQITPPGMEAILARLLAREPAARYPRGSDVQRDLESLALKLGLRASSGAVAEYLLTIFPGLIRQSSATSETVVGKRPIPMERLSVDTEHSMIRRLESVDGLAVFVEETVDQAPTPAPEKTNLDGFFAGRYQLKDELGRGSLGTVFRAVDTSIGEEIALKMMRTSSGGGGIDRFKREIITARRITHPNVLRIHDFGQVGSESYISMELLTGGSLADRIEKGPIPLEEAVSIARGICEGLEAAHAAGIVHRDIKPDNILFDRDGNPKIVDFGLARLVEVATRTIGFSGTPFYMSPEQADGADTGTASDIYSLGVVFFEMFTGSLPFVADGLVQLALMHTQSPPPRPTLIRPDLPPGIETVLLRMLEKDPAARDSTALTVAEDLELAIGRRPSPSSPRLSRPQSRSAPMARPPSLAAPPAPPSAVAAAAHGRRSAWRLAGGTAALVVVAAGGMQVASLLPLGPSALSPHPSPAVSASSAASAATSSPALAAAPSTTPTATHTTTPRLALAATPTATRARPASASPQPTAAGDAGATGHLSVNAFPWVNVAIDDQPVKSTPQNLALAPGTYKLHLENEHDGFSSTLDVTIHPNESLYYKICVKDLTVKRTPGKCPGEPGA